MREDKLTAGSKLLVVAGEILLTPLMGAVLYYAWRKDYPNKARFANISSFCVVGAWILFIILSISRQA